MSLMVGRISYLPDDEKLREIRKKAEFKHRNILLSMVPDGIRIDKISQNYRTEEINSDENVTCYDKLGVSRARNILLEKFYNSDSDYLLLMDDDNSFYDYYNIKMFLDLINKNPENFIKEGVHIVRPVEPQYEPFKKENKKMNCDNYFVFKQCSLFNLTGIFLMINFKKYFGEELYFDEKMKVNCDVDAECEVLDFLIVAMKKGYNCLVCRNMIQKNSTIKTGTSTIFEGSDNIIKHFYQMVDNTCKKYGIMKVNGKRRYSKYLDYYKGILKFDLDGKRVEEGLFSIS